MLKAQLEDIDELERQGRLDELQWVRKEEGQSVPAGEMRPAAEEAESRRRTLRANLAEAEARLAIEVSSAEQAVARADPQRRQYDAATKQRRASVRA